MTQPEDVLRLRELARAAGRFWERADKSGGPDACWLWNASVSAYGYGQFQIKDRRYRAHRVAYALLVGAIPAGLTLDHLCRNRRCVNPAHLEPVTNRENVLRGVGLSAQNAQKTHCPNGHPYDVIDGKGRGCRACKRERGTRSYWRHAEQRRLDARLRVIRRREAAEAQG